MYHRPTTPSPTPTSHKPKPIPTIKPNYFSGR